MIYYWKKAPRNKDREKSLTLWFYRQKQHYLPRTKNQSPLINYNSASNKIK